MGTVIAGKKGESKEGEEETKKIILKWRSV